jgi:hypothetical protein
VVALSEFLTLASGSRSVDSGKTAEFRRFFKLARGLLQ